MSTISMTDASDQPISHGRHRFALALLARPLSVLFHRHPDHAPDASAPPAQTQAADATRRRPTGRAGVRALTASIARMAEGHFDLPIPELDDPQLWRVGNSLNLLLPCLRRLSEAEQTLTRTYEEAEWLAAALYT
ncbi:MAG: hypothetical protein ACRDHP_12470, partial [Ktedonobacterales bacterium]